jgi:Golgi-resident PAP phosphatase
LISEEDVQTKDCPHDEHPFDLDPTVLSSVNLPEINVSTDDVTVWIDPLDATKEYTEKLFHYVSVMICVAIKGEPVIGVVHFPFSQKTFWAWKGKGVSESLADVKMVRLKPESEFRGSFQDD